MDKTKLFKLREESQCWVEDTCLPHLVPNSFGNVCHNFASFNIAFLLRIVDATLIVLDNQFNQFTKVIHIYHALPVLQFREDWHLLGKVHQTREIVSCKLAIDKRRTHDCHLELVIHQLLQPSFCHHFALAINCRFRGDSFRCDHLFFTQPAHIAIHDLAAHLNEQRYTFFLSFLGHINRQLTVHRIVQLL